MTQVLLIEDNADDVELAKRAFHRLGVAENVHFALDGEAALEYLKMAKTPPQLILLDLNLPKISGLEVLRKIRSSPATSQTPIVVLSVSRKEPDLLQSFTMGVNDYFIKPIESDRIVSVYQKYVKDNS